MLTDQAQGLAARLKRVSDLLAQYQMREAYNPDDAVSIKDLSEQAIDLLKAGWWTRMCECASSSAR